MPPCTLRHRPLPDGTHPPAGPLRTLPVVTLRVPRPVRPVVLGTVLVLVLTGLAGVTRAAATARPAVRVLQLNLCGSGYAVCWTGRSVAEAAAVIADRRPEVVTLNETCRDDLRSLGRALAATDPRRAVVLAGFRPVTDRRTGAPIRCRDGQDYGIGVLALTPRGDGSAARVRVEEGVYPAQSGRNTEQRGWLCLTLPADRPDPLTACTTHLDSADPRVALAQCRYLVRVVLPGLRDRTAGGRTVLAGDLNLVDGRRATLLTPCLPAGAVHVDGGAQHILAAAGSTVAAVRSVDLHGSTDHPALLATVSPAERRSAP